MTKRLIIFSAIFSAIFPASHAQAGDIEKGARIYKKCIACHLVGEDAKHRIGPQLNGIVGRTIAGLADYNYSSAMKEYGAEHGAWNEENLDAYLANPRRLIRGTKMSFAGLRKARERADVIAYLMQFQK